jgi:hypothetical protein
MDLATPATLERLLDPLAVCSLKISQIGKAAQRG